MSHAMQHALRNQPKDKPTPHWLLHLAHKYKTTTSDSQAQVQEATLPTAQRHDEQSDVTVDLPQFLKETAVEVRQTKRQDSVHPQPQPKTSNTKPDGAPPQHRQHLVPRDARILPDEEDRRHHLASMASNAHWDASTAAPNGGNGEQLSVLDQFVHRVQEAIHRGPHSSDGTPDPKATPEYKQIMQKISSAATQLDSLLKAMRAPLPTQTGDGSSLPPQHSESGPKIIGELLKDLASLGVKNVANLAVVAKDSALNIDLDDKKYRMEMLIQAAAMLPDDAVDTQLTKGFMTQLWNDLQHPPQTLLGYQYKYRQPDGSNNNYEVPHIGKSGMPYARTVAPMTLQPGALPDAGTLFDTVMARKDDKGTPHPNKISSMLFYLASIIIHDVFKTNRDNYDISDTSSYLDLAPLYGSTWKDQKSVRTLKDGKLKPDCFAEVRLLTFPPGVGALLIMFNRYHNYVAEQLAAINENGRFTEDKRNPEEERYGEKINKRDDDLFQTAKLITCALYVNIILIDYVRTILNLNRTDENWQLNPREDFVNGPPRATGNQVSAEFNLVYRWHAAISTRDDVWTQKLFSQLTKEAGLNMTPAQVAEPQNIYKFLGLLAKTENDFNDKPPEERQFPALKEEVLSRNKDGPYKGMFEDDDLAAILTAGVEDVANAFGPQQVPPVMKVIEILGIKQARTWRMATLNEFRKHFHLEPHREFKDITANEEVQTALKHLYDTPDNVELYPGLVVEDAKRPMLPGSGLCPSYTVSRGVLSDAVALVRGDRFFTTGFTPESLTNWGYTEANYDTTIDNGCCFYKLFLRALPNNYDPASVYVHYPLTVPWGEHGMEEVLKDLKKDKMYNFDKPKPIGTPTVIFSYKAATSIMNNQKDFKVTWGTAIEFLMGPQGKDFMLAGDGTKNADSRKLMEKGLYLGGSSRNQPTGNEPWLKAVRKFYEHTTISLLQQKSTSFAGKHYVDLIRDVGNMAHVHFGAELWALPLKTEKFPEGILTEQQLYMIMAAVFICVFFDVDPPKSFPLRQKAQAATQQLGQFVKILVEVVKHGGDLAQWGLRKADPIAPELREYGVHMIKKLVEADPDVDNLVWGNIMGTAGGMVANQGQLFGQALDFLLSSAEGQKHWPAIVVLAKSDKDEDFDRLMHYFMEASRLNGETGVFRWVAQDGVTVTDTTAPLGEKRYTFKQNDKIMVDLKAASRDPDAFPNPDAIDLTRPLDSYIHLGHGPHQCLGLPMTRVALTTMLKVIAQLEGLQPALVSVGGDSEPSKVKKVVKEFVPGDLKVLPESWHYHEFLTEDWDQYFPFPTSLKVNWTGDLPAPIYQG